MTGYAAVIFLSAFLLFQVQPIIARYILPWFGGSASVWTTCMLFFQVMLLVGYAYAHFVTTRLPIRVQGAVHIALLIGSLLCLPITPGGSWKPTGDEDPTLAILVLLGIHVGIPYLAIASTAPLLQRWFSYSDPARFPTRLYALSNLGSLLGLLTYPILVEPWMPLGTQTLSWSVAFSVFALLCGGLAATLFRSGQPRPTPSATKAPGWALWLALPACGSVMLLATTNKICQDVAVIPFLWILPLGLYLLSFIIAFGDTRWYDRRVWTTLLIPSLAGSVYLLLNDEAHILVQIATFSATLFSACMICHGELVRLKPSIQHLTAFYLMIALGGSLGGVFVTLVAPAIFQRYWEFHVGLVATYGLFALCVFAYGGQRPALPRWVLGAWSVSMLLLLLGLGIPAYEESEDAIATHRSFYAVWQVNEFNRGTPLWRRELYHGAIQHGLQWMDPQYRRYATSYYGQDSGVAVAIKHHPKRLARATGALPGSGLYVGAVGLGTGTIATLGYEGDRFRFYEIDKEVMVLAKEYFHFLSESSAEVQIVLGDARITLAREMESGGSQQFDVLVMDGFSGDAIPVHLLTREAFDLYWNHLTPDGILAVNISNLHLDLVPVVRTLAEEQGKQAVLISNSAKRRDGISSADWVLVTGNQAFLASEGTVEHITEWPTDDIPRVAWRDDYSNLLDLLK